MTFIDVDRVLEGCTLVTAERPLRATEFDRLFAGAASTVTRISPHTARITLLLRPETAAEAASLVVREAECCSFSPSPS